MNVPHAKPPRRIRNLAAVCLIGVLAGTSGMQQSFAQQSSSQSVIFDDPLKQINWIPGPENIGVGDFANVNIPYGFRFTDIRGARVILENANTPVPDDLFGVLANNSGTWWAVLEYNKIGFVKSADFSSVDAAAVLKAVQKQLRNENDGRGITSINWVSQPAFDAKAGSLTWSLQVQSAAAKTLNEGVALLGRHGVMQITAVRPYPLGTAPALSQFVPKNITFKEGESYADYQAGDKVGEIALPQLIAGNTGENHATAAGTAAWVYWVYSGLAVCLAFGGVMMLVRRKQHRHRRARSRVPAPSLAAKPASIVSTPPTQPSAVVASSVAPAAQANGNGNPNGHSQPKVEVPGRNGSKQFHRSRRKRVFDYPKFYTHVMKELSYHSYDTAPTVANGKGGQNGHVNGNGHANGNKNGHQTNGTNGSSGNDSAKSGIEELIATQRSLIQEQKCLLEQQTRLIEEKRWLIEEQTAFLKGQTGMISEQQYPLKFE